MHHKVTGAGPRPAPTIFSGWLRALAAACLLTFLAYGCTDQDCRRTFTCPDTDPLTATSANQPDASLGGTDPEAEGEVAAALQVCPAGQHSCPSGCVSNADPLTCGASCSPCDVPIDGRATCDGVRCGGACEQSKTLCFGACIDQGATCERSCGEGTHECSGLCPSNDSVNACGEACDPCPVPESALQASCVDGACGFVCQLGYHPCGDTCQRDTDVEFCGPACEPCVVIENGFPACNNRVCTVWCERGFHVCDEQCVPNDSPDSCGETSCTPCTAPAGGTATCGDGVCGTECPTGEKLCAGVCISVDAACSGICPEGTHNCSESCVPNDSAAQCGVDCVSCPVLLGATAATCVDGQCGIASCREPGFRQCGDLCPLVDSLDACGPQCELCSADPNDPDAERSCQNDECGILCSAGFHLCEDGCSGDTDVDACGPDCAVCAAPQGGSVTCVNGACVSACPDGMKQCAGVCIPNAEACDGACPEGTHNCSNFCVDDTLVSSCGTRCTACPAPPDFGAAQCLIGACEIACEPGFHSCGVECAPDTDPNRCGDGCRLCTVADSRTQRPACQAGQCVSQCLGTAEVCDAAGLDEDCDGEVNEGCDCIPGTSSATSTCGVFYAAQNPVGVCSTRSLTCSAAGLFPSFNAACVAQTSEVCDAARLDDDCDGQANEGCTCAEGQTTTCGALYPTSQGSCAARALACSAGGTWPAQNGNCTPATGTRDSCTVAGDDANCNGVPNDACTCTSPTGTLIPAGGTVGCGPCSSGTRVCQGGTLLPCSVPDVACAGCCNGSGTTATCTANGATNLSACGTAGEACSACSGPSSGTGSPTCVAGNCGITCTNGLAPVNGTCGPECGNLLREGTEECDDGNEVWGDTCYQCAQRFYFVLNSPSTNSTGNDSIVRVSKNGGVTTLRAPDPALNGARDLAIEPDGSRLYVLQANFGLAITRILYLDPLTGAELDAVSLDQTLLGYEAFPTNMVRSFNGLLYIVVGDLTNADTRLISLNPDTKAVVEELAFGSAVSTLDLAEDNSGSLLLTSSGQTFQLSPAFDNWGVFPTSTPELQTPFGITYDVASNQIWIANSNTDPPQVYAFDSNGIGSLYADVTGYPFENVRGLLIDDTGLPLVPLGNADEIVSLNPDGSSTVVWGSPVGIDYPTDIVVLDFSK